MSMQEGLAIFERAVEARGKLLRAEADRAGAVVGVLALTFDVGRIVIRPADEGLEAQALAGREELPDGLGGIDEEDPWWRILGQPITAAWPGGVEEGVGATGLGSLMVLKMRFREESENPRTVVLEAAGKGIRVKLEG